MLRKQRKGNKGKKIIKRQRRDIEYNLRGNENEVKGRKHKRDRIGNIGKWGLGDSEKREKRKKNRKRY